jgi:murein DD-endopeptidase MepM/ murein hydrolase activator NlpD
MGRLTEKLTVMILPDGGSEARKLQIPRWAIQYWRTILTAFVVLLLLEAVGIAVLVYQLVQLQGIKADNEYLVAENAQISRIAAEFNRLRILDQQIRRSLGANIGLEGLDTLALDTTLFGLQENPVPYNPSSSAVRVSPGSRETLSSEPAWLTQGFTSRDVPTFLPVEGFITRDFFWSDELPLRDHAGIDIAGTEGTPVLAAADGMVTFSDWTYRYGNLVILYHRSGYFTVYGHLQLRNCKVRDWVKQGESIGLLGNSGVSSAPHLHFEIWRGTEPVNPRDLIWGLAGNE